jgi:predicted PurR-regulated permease PerM
MAVSIGGYYAGLVGMILAVPIAGIIQIFIRRWAAAKEEEKMLANPESTPKMKKSTLPKS